MTSVITNNGTRWLAALVASAMVLALMIGGDQRSAQAIPPGATDIVYVADGYDFPDALMGATVAALNAAPMLGVRGPDSGDFVPPDTADELDRLTNNKANKLTTIYIFGGPAAVSDKVKADLGAWANDVQRIFGDNRFGTMQAISEALPTKVKDSDLLDGKDSTEFLGANAKAADSELLDGMDSSALATRQRPLDFQSVTSSANVTLAPGDLQTLLTITVNTPDRCGDGSAQGNYLVAANGTVRGDTSDADATDTTKAAYARQEIKLDSGTSPTEPNRRLETLYGTAGGGGFGPFSTLTSERVVTGVTPGSHDINLVINNFSSSDFPVVYEDGFHLQVYDLGSTCS